jgi:2-methylcitrate dehydratase
MVDEVSRALAGLVRQRRAHAVPSGPTAAILDRIADSMLLAAGSWDEEAVGPVERYADDSGVGGDCHAWGSSARYRPYEAALLNGTAARVLDYNDAYFGLDSSHPSDVIPALFAVAEDRGASLDELVRAIEVAYAVIIAFSDHVKSRAVGWDHAMTTGLGACCGIGQLLGLDDEQLQNAVAIHCTSSMTGRQTRASSLTSWKAIAAPFSSARAIEAARLAGFGAVGPLEPFLGPHGYLTAACRGTFDLDALLAALDPSVGPVVQRTHLKLWPVGYLAHSALDAARRLHERRGGRRLRRVRILTVDATTEIMDAPDKRWPQTRETADHSLAYSVVAVLELGDIGSSVFDPVQIATNGIRELVRDCVEIEASDAFNARYPSEQPARVEVEFEDGTRDAEETDCALGHANRPAGPADLDRKFARLFAGRTVFGPLRSALEEAESVADVLVAFERIVTPARRSS